jgi:hypothetical protein
MPDKIPTEGITRELLAELLVPVPYYEIDKELLITRLITSACP